jgi:hypothetical protein
VPITNYFQGAFIMPYKYCQHVRENGSFCGSAAVRGRRHCYFHLRTRARQLAIAQAQSKRKPWHPELPPLEDMQAVQAALMQVLDGIAAGALDAHRGTLLLDGLKQAAINLRNTQAWIGRSRFGLGAGIDDRTVDCYPGLEAEFGLPEEVDLDARPEEAFPPPVLVPQALTTSDWLVAVHNALRDSGKAIDGAALEENWKNPAPALPVETSDHPRGDAIDHVLKSVASDHTPALKNATRDKNLAGATAG